MVATSREIDVPLPLDADIVESFNKQGFARIKNVLGPATIARYEPEISGKVVELNTMRLPLEQRSTYDKAFLQIENLWQHSDLVKELVFSRRLAQIASDLLGVEAVRLYHDQALYKDPSGGVTPWHADQFYWPLSSDRTCTVWIPLQETPLEMGPLEFAVGCQDLVFGRDLPISDASEIQLEKALAEGGYQVVSGGYELGEVSYHLGWTYHHAQANRSRSPRRAMTVIYMDANITVSQPVNQNQRNDLRNWMPGAVVGAVPATPLNPVL